VLLFEFFLV